MSGSARLTRPPRLVRRVVPHRPAPRLPAGNREVSPDGPVLVQRLGTRV